MQLAKEGSTATGVQYRDTPLSKGADTPQACGGMGGTPL